MNKEWAIAQTIEAIHQIEERLTENKGAPITLSADDLRYLFQCNTILTVHWRRDHTVSYESKAQEAAEASLRS